MLKRLVPAALLVLFLVVTVSADQPAGDPPLTYLEQGWSQEDRMAFYVQKEPGIWIMPYEWFEKLERADSKPGDIKMLNDPAFFKRYRILLDPTVPNNLPVGFIKSAKPVERPLPNPLLTKVHYVGQTCASCHTGQLIYKGKAYRIDGGSGMLDLLSFGGQIQASLMALRDDPDKFGRFAARLGITTPAQRGELYNALIILLRVMDNVSPLGDKVVDQSQLPRLYPLPWGFGRGDALGRGGNTLLAPLVSHDARHPLGNPNRVPANAPVSTPHIWYSPQYDWVEWNGSIQNPMGRNIAQAITTGRRLAFQNPLQPYQSDVKLDVLHELEQEVIKKLTAPRWPQEFPFNSSLAIKGKKLYVDHCMKCHVPEQMAPNAFGQIYRMYAKSMTPLHEIGTDPIMASNFYSRQVRTGAIKGVPDGAAGKEMVPAKEGMRLITSGMMKAGNWSKTPIEPNEWRAPLAYIARLNAGIWATAPFLHNGSIPTLYALLSPREERPSQFCTGNLEFDPTDVGYKSGLQGCEPTSIFDTTLSGNSNAGHEFRKLLPYEEAYEKSLVADGKTTEVLARPGHLGPYFEPSQRREIIEYMKTCDLEYSADEGWQKNDPKLCGLKDQQ